MSEEHVEVSFTVGVRRKEKRRAGKLYGYSHQFAGAWVTRPDYVDNGVQLLRITLELPESLWAMPQAKGRLESRMQEEFELLIEELS